MHIRRLVFLFVFAASAGIALAPHTASAQGLENVSYPVAELGGCESREACHAYCEQPENMEQCIAFARDNGIMDERQAHRAEQFAAQLEEEGGPGDCRTPKECRAYCEEPGNLKECIAFAQESGMVGDAELEKMQTMARLIEEGKTPGGCRSRSECEAYCEESGNMEECIAFAKEAGFISGKQAEAIQGPGFEGPGGCRSRSECEAYCSRPANQQTCFQFAREHGLMSEEELKHIEEGQRHLKSGFQDAPPAVYDCLKNKVDPAFLEAAREGSFTPNPETARIIRSCFEEVGADHDVPDEAFKGAHPKATMPNIPSFVNSCVRTALGGNFKERFAAGELSEEEIAKATRGCVEQHMEGNAPGPGDFPEPPQEFHKENGDFQEQEHEEQFEKQFEHSPQQDPSQYDENDEHGSISLPTIAQRSTGGGEEEPSVRNPLLANIITVLQNLRIEVR